MPNWKRPLHLVYLGVAVARRLDDLFRRMLEGPVDQVVGHFAPSAA